MRIVIVGGGRQGLVIARNLLSRPEKPEVIICDLREPQALPPGATYQKADVLNADQAKALSKGADTVVLAVPSEIAHRALKNIIASGVPVADVSFTPDPPLDLDEEAKKTGSCVVVDCGIAPGLSHILVGQAITQFKGLDAAKILVGGMPQKPSPVFEHAVYFNPHDLLAEYIRPARARKNGKNINPAPLDAPIENHKDEELGNLEAFLSDGLRSLLTSYPEVKEMSELTLRWPGHLKTMSNLRELGLLDSPAAVRELAYTLAEKYPADENEDVLLMVVEAIRGDKHRTWRLIDRRTDGESAMSRTTGFTTAAVAMILARKQFTEAGVHAPERLGQDIKLAEAVVADLSGFGIKVTELVSSRA